MQMGQVHVGDAFDAQADIKCDTEWYEVVIMIIIYLFHAW